MGALYDLFHNGEYGTTKCHHYFPVYEHYLAPLVGKPVRVLEIGCAGGGGLRMLRAYLGPQAVICGMDVNKSCRRFRKEGFPMFIGSQDDPDLLAEAIEKAGPFDVVIDDGSHFGAHQIASFEALFPTMPATGVYIIEDTMMSFSTRYQNGFSGQSIADYAKAATDKLCAWHLAGTWGRMGMPPDQRPETALEVPAITRMTKGIYFYDCRIVFESGEIEEQWREKRWSAIQHPPAEPADRLVLDRRQMVEVIGAGAGIDRHAGRPGCVWSGTRMTPPSQTNRL